MAILHQAVVLLGAALCVSAATKPHVIMIMADDMGWDDTSTHGSKSVLTPNLDVLTRSGVSLHRYYTHALCSPARTAVLTGKYAHTVGMQGMPLSNAEERGIPLEERLISQYLQDAGYRTQIVGKWHVGHAFFEQLPTYRGFENHFGVRGGFIDYYEYNAQEQLDGRPVTGLCLFDDLQPDWTTEGYITDVYTEKSVNIIENHNVSEPLYLLLTHHAPHNGNEDASLQAPPEEVRAQRHVELHPRRIFAAMVKKLDDSIGEIVATLEKKGMLENTIITFSTDNGAPTVGLGANSGSNYPLRGVKKSPWEGGIRGNAMIWAGPEVAPGNEWRGKVYDGNMHAADWVPTLLQAIGEVVPKNLDGFPMWNEIIENKPSPRNEIFEIDDYFNHSSVTLGRHKLVKGTIDESLSKHYGADLRGIIGTPPDYKQKLRDSKAWESLETIGIPLDADVMADRDEAIITCGDVEPKPCSPSADSWCLYDIIEDPCELRDLSEELPQLAQILLYRLEQEEAKIIPRESQYIADPRSAPKYFNYTWDAYLSVEPYTDSA
uniref:Glucosinolate sulfatase 1-2 n=1 Tax=Plutella australiana TaxID=1405358 RepID=A0A3G5BLU7_9NEOP|nr:glucosinolate sulfatase 1-2 [Plutella australiana]